MLISPNFRLVYLPLALVCMVLSLALACSPAREEENSEPNTIHLLVDLSTFSSDSLVQVVVEIPSGSNEKWEVNKKTGQLEWQKISEDSMRVVDYLAYPANYGFVPQTYLPKEAGGDGDPVDIFVLGPSLARESVLQVHLIGMIHMKDRGEEDAKLLAVRDGASVIQVRSMSELEQHYTGVLEILSTWLQNYKGPGQVEVLSLGDQQEAWNYLYEAHQAYQNQKP